MSPQIAYCSGQPGVAGTSHESLRGIIDSARFFLPNDVEGAREILGRRNVDFVFVYDSDRVIANSVALLGTASRRIHYVDLWDEHRPRRRHSSD